MLGSKFPDQEVAWKASLVYASVYVHLVVVCAFEVAQCVHTDKIKLRDEAWCKVLALRH